MLDTASKNVKNEHTQSTFHVVSGRGKSMIKTSIRDEVGVRMCRLSLDPCPLII